MLLQTGSIVSEDRSRVYLSETRSIRYKAQHSFGPSSSNLIDVAATSCLYSQCILSSFAILSTFRRDLWMELSLSSIAPTWLCNVSHQKDVVMPTGIGLTILLLTRILLYQLSTLNIRRKISSFPVSSTVCFRCAIDEIVFGLLIQTRSPLDCSSCSYKSLVMHLEHLPLICRRGME